MKVTIEQAEKMSKRLAENRKAYYEKLVFEYGPKLAREIMVMDQVISESYFLADGLEIPAETINKFSSAWANDLNYVYNVIAYKYVQGKVTKSEEKYSNIDKAVKGVLSVIELGALDILDSATNILGRFVPPAEVASLIKICYDISHNFMKAKALEDVAKQSRKTIESSITNDLLSIKNDSQFKGIYQKNAKVDFQKLQKMK